MLSVRPLARQILRCPNFRSFSERCEVPTPRMLYIQHPWTWLKIKYQFAALQHTWDPNFRERDFKMGTKTAICVMTNLVRSHNVETMKPMTTKSGFKQISVDSISSKQDPRLTLLDFRPDDIKHVVPLRVTFVETIDHNHCYIDVYCTALRYVNNLIAHNPAQRATILSVAEKMGANLMCPPDVHHLVFAETMVRFHRCYEKQSPVETEWNFDFYKVIGFHLLDYRPSSSLFRL